MKYLAALRDNLKSRFPHVPIMAALYRLCNAGSYSDCVDMYGDFDVQNVSRHYSGVVDREVSPKNGTVESEKRKNKMEDVTELTTDESGKKIQKIVQKANSCSGCCR
eukprot:Pompholyxophrys_punicea_v1_NODE_553_length_1698_cov_3.227024.p2 type:complete len:107 gc:universal NODE_553_length_1698_cov_3.227024:1068-1388(+)